MSTVTLTDVGPIERLSIPVPDGGGVVVLRGRNGTGKTTALNAAASLISGKVSVSPRDGCQRGEVDGFGATLRLGRRSSRSGELEVISLDGRMSPADLVDPGMKSEDAADATRIKALLQLTNATPDVKDFWKLAGGQAEFEAACPEDLSSVTDAVALAGRVKRAFEATARRHESAAENEAGKSAAYRKSVEGIDTAIVTDQSVLQSRLEDAVREQQRLNSEALNAERRAAQVAQAKVLIESYEATDLVDYVSEIARLHMLVTTADQQVVESRKEVKAIESALAEARINLKSAESNRDSLSGQFNAASQNSERQTKARAAEESAMESARQIVAAADSIPCPTADELQAANVAVDQAREAIEAAAVARRALDQLVTADSHAAKAKELVKLASRIREGAKGTDDILSAMVAQCGTPLVVRDGRLWLETKRGLTLFAELSHGERWKVAIDIAVNAFTDDSDHLPVLTIPQEAFEGLDGINREIVAKHARDCGVVILTAECSTDESITAEAM